MFYKDLDKNVSYAFTVQDEKVPYALALMGSGLGSGNWCNR